MAANDSKKSSPAAEKNSLLPSPKKAEGRETTAHYLKDVKAVIVEQGLGKTRAAILTKQLTRHGGVKTSKLSPDTTHILVGNSTKLAKLAGILKVKKISEEITVLRADWLSDCLKEGRLVDCTPFSLKENDTGKILSNTESMSYKAQGKRSIDALDDLSSAVVKNHSSASSNCQLATTSKDGPACKRQKVDEGDSDYVNSDDDTEEEGTDSGEGAVKPTEISPHISPHKKVMNLVGKRAFTCGYGTMILLTCTDLHLSCLYLELLA